MRPRRRIAAIVVGAILLTSGGVSTAFVPLANASQPTTSPQNPNAGGSPASSAISQNAYEGLANLQNLFAEQGANVPGSPADQAENAVENGAVAGLAAERSGSLAEEFGARIGDETFTFFFDFGLDALMKAAFGNPQASGFASLEREISFDFQQTMAQLTAIENSLKNLSGQISSTQAAAANTQCATAMSQASQYVTTIQVASTNLQSILNVPWVKANLTSTGAVQDMNTVGVAIFGGNAGSPKFLSGLNQVQVATSDLATLLTTDANSSAQGLVEACADATAANIAVALNPGQGSPAPLAVGLAESSYFGTMQTIVGYYASFVNIGRGLTTLGSQLAMGVTMVPPPSTISDVTDQCAGASPAASPGVMTCGGILQFNDVIGTSYTNAWQATGAGWAQMTDGYVASALGFNPATGYFANGDVAWVTDIAKANRSTNPLTSLSNPSYQARSNNSLISRPGLQTLSTWGADAPSPTSGSYSPSNPVFVNADGYVQAGLAQPSYGTNPQIQKALSVFTPATSSHWNALLNNNNQANTTNNENCFVNASGDLTSCLNTMTVGDLIGMTGLMNDGQRTFDNMILYTGETGVWSVNPTTTALNFNGAFQGTNGVPYTYNNDVRALSFLDTNIQPNTGFSVVFNDPSADDGVMGVNTIYPFFTGYQASNGVYTQSQTTNTTYSMGFFPVATNNAFVPGRYASAYLCSPGASNWTPMLLSMILGSKSAPYTGQILTNGDSLAIKCGSPGSPAFWGGTPGSMPFTGNTQFYRNPVLSLSQLGTSMAFVSCQSSGAAVACNPSDFLQTPGFLLNATPNYAQQTLQNYSIPAVNGAPTALNPQQQYTWPVIDLNPSTTPCRLTNFSQGSSGNIGIPQACAAMFNMFAAANWGADIGAIDVFLSPNTQTPNGSQVTARTINASGAPITGALAVSFAQVNTTGAAGWTTSTKGASVGQCATNFSTYFPTQNGQRNMLVCSVTIPPGGASFTAALPSGNSASAVARPASVLFSNASGTQVAGSAKTLTNQSAQTLLPPGPVTGLSAAISNGNAVTITWNTPKSSSPVTGYVLNATGPSGQASPQTTIPITQVTATGDSSSVTYPLPSSGLWTISLAAQNASGTGLAGSTIVALGTAKPSAPQNLMLIERTGGGVEFSWTPVLASPSVDNYVIQATSPTGVKAPVISVEQANALLPTPGVTGTWTYAVYAVNALGNGPVSTATINIQGGVPNPVAALVPTVDSAGRMNVTFSGSPGTVPAATSYTLAIFAPDQYGKPLAQQVIPAAGNVNSYTVAGFYEFGRNSPSGSYVVVIMPTNATGNGYITYSPVFLTTAFIKTLDRVAPIDQEVKGAAMDLAGLELKACREGRPDSITYLTGVCVAGVWTRR